MGDNRTDNDNGKVFAGEANQKPSNSNAVGYGSLDNSMTHIGSANGGEIPRRLSVSTEECEAIAENCLDGTPPGTEETRSAKKIVLPVVTTMTKLLFDRYRKAMFSYLEELIRYGVLEELVGYPILTRRFDKSNCEFSDTTFWRVNHLRAEAEIVTRLKLDTPTGILWWTGYLIANIDVADEDEICFSISTFRTEKMQYNKDRRLLSPFLIPYFTGHEIDEEAEKIWSYFLPEALHNKGKRNAYKLAEAMGLEIRYYPIYKHDSVDSILFLIEDSILVQDKESKNQEQPKEEIVPKNTIVINTNNIKRDYSAFHVYHECIHYYEHYLFFRIQNMISNDVLNMETVEVTVAEGKSVNNPVYWMENHANRGAYALMMPLSDITQRLQEKLNTIKGCLHEGHRYEMICDALAKDLGLPAFRVRARLIQLGHIHAKGAVNYVDRKRIDPFTFERDSLCVEELTFVIDRGTVHKLYEKNDDFKRIIDSKKYIYADGHIVKNDLRFVKREYDVLKLTPWASEHVDKCCLRFVRVYVQKNAGLYVFGRMYLDTDYIKQTAFYLEDFIKQEKLQGLDELDVQEMYVQKFPRSFDEAFKMLVRNNDISLENVAEQYHMVDKTLGRWIIRPDTKITADFVMYTTLLLKLPDWLSNLMFKRAHIQLDDDDKRHAAFKYIQRVMWMDGIEKANEFLKQRRLEPLSLSQK